MSNHKSNKITVTKRVYTKVTQHGYTYNVLAAVPGQEISHERAVELGLVKPEKKAEPKKAAAPKKDVETAEVRRGKPGS